MSERPVLKRLGPKQKVRVRKVQVPKVLCESLSAKRPATKRPGVKISGAKHPGKNGSRVRGHWSLDSSSRVRDQGHGSGVTVKDPRSEVKKHRSWVKSQ